MQFYNKVKDMTGYGKTVDENAVTKAAKHYTGSKTPEKSQIDYFKSVYEQAISYVSSGSSSTVTHGEVNEAYKKVQESKSEESHDSKTLGGAAVYSAFQQFMSKEESKGGSSTKTEGKYGEKDGKAKIIGYAMSHAAKIYDTKGKKSGSSKDEVISQAAQYAAQLYDKKGQETTTTTATTTTSSKGGYDNLIGYAKSWMK